MSESTAGGQAGADEPPTHPDTMSEAYPWIRHIETMPNNPHPEDYKVQTNLGQIDMDTHVHALENHGYAVERIVSNQPYGQQLYCTIS